MCCRRQWCAICLIYNMSVTHLWQTFGSEKVDVSSFVGFNFIFNQSARVSTCYMRAGTWPWACTRAPCTRAPSACSVCMLTNYIVVISFTWYFVCGIYDSCTPVDLVVDLVVDPFHIHNGLINCLNWYYNLYEGVIYFYEEHFKSFVCMSTVS